MKGLEAKIKKVLELASAKRPRDSRFSYIDPELVLELTEAGVIPRDIARIYGCGTRTLSYQMKRKGYEYDGRAVFRREDISVGEVVESYKKGAKITELARKHNTTQYTIRSRLEEGGIKFQKKKEVKYGPEVFAGIYLKGLSQISISRILNCSIPTVLSRLEDAGVCLRPYEREDIPEDEVCSMFKKGSKVNRIARTYDTAPAVIRRILCANGYLVRRRHGRDDIPVDKVCKMYKDNVPFEDIVARFGCSEGTIYARLHEGGIETKRKGGIKTPNLPMRRIRNQHKKGMTISELSREYNCCWTTIKNIVKPK